MSEDRIRLGDLAPETILVPTPITPDDVLKRDRAIAALVLERDLTLQQAADALREAYAGIDEIMDALVEEVNDDPDGAEPMMLWIKALRGVDGLIDDLMAKGEGHE